MERAFWREVGARTISGVLTIVIIGVPALVWGALSGALQWQTVAPILTGIALFGGLAFLYILTIVFIRRRERAEIETALHATEWINESMSKLAREYGVSVSPEKRAEVLDTMMNEHGDLVLSIVRKARRRARVRAQVVFVVAIYLAIASTRFVLENLKLWEIIPR